MDDSARGADAAIEVETEYRFAMIPESVLWHPDLTAEDVRVYGTLARFGNGSGERSPSRRLIAERCGRSVDTVDRSLRNLEAVGAVAIERRRVTKDGKVRHLSSVYRLVQVAAEARPGVAADTRPGSRADAARGSRADAAQPKEDLPREPDRENDARRVVLDALFDAFWTTYPRKIGKPAARRAWNGALRDATDAGPRLEQRAAAIMAGLEPWVAYWTVRADPEFVPHPTTWLNQRRWRDQAPVAGGRAATRAQAREAREAAAVASSAARFDELRRASGEG